MNGHKLLNMFNVKQENISSLRKMNKKLQLLKEMVRKDKLDLMSACPHVYYLLYCNYLKKNAKFASYCLLCEKEINEPIANGIKADIYRIENEYYYPVGMSIDEASTLFVSIYREALESNSVNDMDTIFNYSKLILQHIINTDSSMRLEPLSENQREFFNRYTSQYLKK